MEVKADKRSTELLAYVNLQKYSVSVHQGHELFTTAPKLFEQEPVRYVREGFVLISADAVRFTQ